MNVVVYGHSPSLQMQLKRSQCGSSSTRVKRSVPNFETRRNQVSLKQVQEERKKKEEEKGRMKERREKQRKKEGEETLREVESSNGRAKGCTWPVCQLKS